MSSTIKNVAIVGAGGTIGRPILTALLQSNLFDTITLLTRDPGSFTLPDTCQSPTKISLKKISYTTPDSESLPSLVSALSGVDAVVSALGFHHISQQSILVQAAVQAGVKRFIPSEYGNDTLDARLQDIPIYIPKITIRKQCEVASKETNGKFTWTTIQNASFLAPDWTLDFLVDVRNRKADLKDGGDVLFTATTYEDVGRAVVGILTHPHETTNRPVKISSVDTTQNEIISIAKELVAEEKNKDWEIKHSSCDEDVKEARQRWFEQGDRSEEVVALFINWAFIGVRCGYFPEVRDNELLAIRGCGRDGLREIIKKRLEMDH